jgi:hypothetical protein
MPAILPLPRRLLQRCGSTPVRRAATGTRASIGEFVGIRVGLPPEEWRERIGRLAKALGADPTRERADDPGALVEAIPEHRISPLAEENDRFFVTAILSAGPGRIRTATVTWMKRPFDPWWAEKGRAAIEAAGGATDSSPVRAPEAGTWSAR